MDWETAKMLRKAGKRRGESWNDHTGECCGGPFDGQRITHDHPRTRAMGDAQHGDGQYVWEWRKIGYWVWKSVPPPDEAEVL
jgi:hypothetical protein